MTQPSFALVRRGFDPDQVTKALQRAQQAHSAALQESAEKTVEATRLASELNTALATADELRAQVESLTVKVGALEASKASPLTYADLGPRISTMLTLAQDEADELRSNARAAADALIADATAEANRVRSAAEAYAVDTRSRTDAESARTMEIARREADEALDHAEREASARRREAEAVYEEKRALAAAASAEFEKTLATRRDRAASEFAAQMANHERALTVASEKLSEVEEEAARVQRDARAEGDAERERATAEATQLLDNARIHAERIRRDSERELAALASRRDSITEQLANVRQMLATLGGGAAQALAEGAADPQPVFSEKATVADDRVAVEDDSLETAAE